MDGNFILTLSLSVCDVLLLLVSVSTLYNSSFRVKVQEEAYFKISQEFCNMVEIKRSHGVEACTRLSLFIRCFDNTNTSVQNFAVRISSFHTVPKCLRKPKVFFNKFNVLHAIVIVKNTSELL